MRASTRLFSLIALLVAAVPATLSAQAVTGRLRGTVVDARTGQPLARVRLLLQSAADPAAVIETVTAADGRFEITAPAGGATLTASAIGYALTRLAVTVPAGGVQDEAVTLSEGTGGTYTEEVRVLGDLHPVRDPGVPGEQTLTGADLQNLRSTIADDPMRALQTMPGVAATDDLRSEFSIRGEDFRHIGVALDGVPSPLLVHTVHGINDAGSLAMINSDILDTVTVSPGSYPQRYGDRTGAFVDFRTRDGATDRVHARVSASAVNASALVEGPVGGGRRDGNGDGNGNGESDGEHGARGSWLVAARTSFADWIVKRVDPQVTASFDFTDLQGKLTYALSPRHTLRVNFVAGRSQFEDRERDGARYGGNTLDVGRNQAGIVSVSLRSALTPRLTVTQQVYGVAGRYQNLNPSGFEIGRGSSREVSYRTDASLVLSPALVLEAGGHLQWLGGTGRETTIDQWGYTYSQSFDASASRQSAYGLVRWQPRAWLTLSPGARVDHWTITGQTQASPWLQTDWRLPRAWTVSAAGGLYRQAPELDEVYGPRGSEALATEQAWQADAGVGQRIGAWRWQATVFLREESNQLRLQESEPKIRAGFVIPPSYLTRYENALDVSSRGFELMLVRRAPNGLSGWIGYAYAHTRDDDVNRDERFDADFDQRHTFNAYGRYRLSDRLSVSARYRYGSNVPIPGYLRPEPDGFTYDIIDRRNDTRLPAYSRLDLRADRTFTLGRNRLTLYADILNVFNRHNLRAVEPQYLSLGSIYFSPFAAGVTERLFPIIPSVGLTVEF